MDAEFYRKRIREAAERHHKKNDPVEIYRRKKEREARPKKERSCPLEYIEHRNFARVLEKLGLFYAHVPNEGKLANSREEAKIIGYRRKLMGVKKGCPDFLIFSSVPSGGVGCAIELKRITGSSPLWGRPEQHDFLRELDRNGWSSWVARGCEAGISILIKLGYITERKRNNEDDTDKLIRQFKHQGTGTQERDNRSKKTPVLDDGERLEANGFRRTD